MQNKIFLRSLKIILFALFSFSLHTAIAQNNDALIHQKIRSIQSIASHIRIDGRGLDWRGIPSFSEPAGDVYDPSRDITNVSIAPRQNDLLIFIATAARPSQEDRAFWFDIDFSAHQIPDIQIGLSSTGTHTLWINEEGHASISTQLAGIEVQIRDIVEVRIPYQSLVQVLPASMVQSLMNENMRPWMRVFPFTWDFKTQSYIDYGPAVASFRLTSSCPLDATLPVIGTPPLSIELPVHGKWYLGQGAFGAWTHQNVWAYDLYIVDDTLQASYPRDSRINTDYHSWNKPVFSPLSGKVIRTFNNAPDLPPKSASAQHAPNEVYLDIGNGIGLWFGHFKQGSVGVSTGQTVSDNQPLGFVGNSGNTSWSHLHIGFWQLPEGAITLPMALANIRVSLNPQPNDFWERDLDQWEPREGVFVERQ